MGKPNSAREAAVYRSRTAVSLAVEPLGHRECGMQQSTPKSAAAQLAGELEKAHRVVAFTGAGISTESGIPDFRSPGGIWDRYQPIDFREFVTSEEKRRESWRRKLATDRLLAKAAPNDGHHALCRLYQAGRLRTVITQNVDGLHQASGLPADRVIEVHGNSTYAACLSCAERHELAPILEAFDRHQVLPTCDHCGGLVKTATISFGQPMPAEAMDRAEHEVENCDLFLVLGTSLVVYPAAGLPRRAKHLGARLAIVNRDPTEQDELADLVLHASLGQVLRGAVELILAG